MSEQTRSALLAARNCIRGDRYDDGLGSLAEYDAVLAQIDAALAAPAKLTDEQIVSIRDEHLPSQGETFDCIAFARAIERALEGK